MTVKKDRVIPEVCLPHLSRGPDKQGRLEWRRAYAKSWRGHPNRYTLQEIANAMGVTRERVRQILVNRPPKTVSHPRQTWKRPRDDRPAVPTKMYSRIQED